MDTIKPILQVNPSKVNGGETTTKADTEANVKTNATEKTMAEVQADKEKELDEPYFDRRTIIIAPVALYSAYRNMNRATMGPRKTVIGSSITSSRILASNAKEVETYFPQLVGVSPSNPEFLSRVKAYLNNISFNVEEAGTPLNVSFHYNKKSDYLAIKKEEEAINKRKDSVPRNNIKAIKEATKTWQSEINALESKKYALGHPDNIEEYLMYRHCILYRDVAKDLALINSDHSVRFYIRDEEKEKERARKLTKAKSTAMRNFIAAEGSDRKIDAIYLQIAITNNVSVGEALIKSRDEKIANIMTYLNEHPDKFNAMFDDKNIEMKAFIETLIARGELIRSDYNQQISLPDGTFIGANVIEAIGYFNNPANATVYETFKNKLKLF